MGFEAFGLAQRHRRRSQRAQLVRPAFEDRRSLHEVKHPEAGRNIDYVGAALFAAAIGPILVGLSNKRSLEWTDPWVGGLILLGAVMVAVFLWWETRAVDPIIRLSLFRNRTITISVLSMFLAAFGFFGAIVFLPQWFQVVRGMGATESGLNLLPLVFALLPDTASVEIMGSGDVTISGGAKCSVDKAGSGNVTCG